MNLSSSIKSIQDIMRKDDGVDGDAQRLGQLTWMLFLKVFDQREKEWEEQAEQENSNYISPIPNGYRWRDWAKMEIQSDGKKKHTKSSSEIIDFINNKLFPTLKEEIDPTESNKHKVVKSVFEDANNYMKSGNLMLAVIEKIEDSVDIDDFKVRINLGDVYEQLLNDIRGAGNSGEFYTPRAITQFMVQMVNPRLDNHETVLDPACGTGGFLTASIDHFLTQDKRSRDEKLKDVEKLVFGFEKKQLPHLLCTTNMLIHGIDIPDRITRMNTLGKPWNQWLEQEKKDCVITNPPFGGYEEDGVGTDYPSEIRTRETADMFMVLIIEKLLKDTGRAAVVLPDGFMFGEGIKAKVKEILLEKCNLHTVIRLPKGVFAPYTTIKSNLLFFTKGKRTESIWFYEHPYPNGYKSYSKTKPIRIEEFNAEKNWWGTEENNFAERVESEIAWKVDFKAKREDALKIAQPYWNKAKQYRKEAKEKERKIQQLKSDLKRLDKKEDDLGHRTQIEEEINHLTQEVENLFVQEKDAQNGGDRLYSSIYNLDIKNPNVSSEESHDPVLLLEKYLNLLDEIEETENILKNELASVLAHRLHNNETIDAEE
ncbi:class I SAM-dependent DNA methyltransferase [Acinetobacter oleivorans]|uniref:class I SAM-dependent DNA methyltransferase n=1 Tax=Acinetobacter oleivorans TaxID=1148157 RepID=UPI00226C7AE7|nr:N-6 DNA methylase [Acinetobacter oleivorans]